MNLKDIFPALMGRRGSFTYLAVVSVIYLVIAWIFSFSLATFAFYICALILGIQITDFSRWFSRTQEFTARWPMYLFAGGLAAFLTLYNLYNPSRKVFTNVEHHHLSLLGFQTYEDQMTLLGQSGQPALWDQDGLVKKAVLVKEGNTFAIRGNMVQPVYQRINKTIGIDSILNKEGLPQVVGSFDINFKQGKRIRVILQDVLKDDHDYKAEGTPKNYTRAWISFLNEEGENGPFEAEFRRYISRSYPLQDLLKSVILPENIQFDWSSLDGMTLVRELAGVKVEDYEKQRDRFRLALTTGALAKISSITGNGNTYEPESLLKESHVKVENNRPVCIGAGLQATPFILPEEKDGLFTVNLFEPLSYNLPNEKDSLGNQSLVVTSDLREMSSSYTTNALYYPVFPTFKDNLQFKIALEYLPEETRVPLICRLQMFGEDRIVSDQIKDDSDIQNLQPGTRFAVVNDKRYISPVFQFVNQRETVPFTSTSGYLLIVTVLACALVSLCVGWGRFENRTETALWLGFLTLMVFRSFIAWRTQTFMPFEGFSLSLIANYVEMKYVFHAAWLLPIFVVALPAVLYKLYMLFINRNGKLLACPRWLSSNVATDRNMFCRFITLPLLAMLVAAVPFAAGMIVSSPRITYVFAPVVLFFVSEFLYHTCKDEPSYSKDFVGLWSRYITMMLALCIPLAADPGFGIIFTLFLLLYNAVDCYFFMKTDNGRDMVKDPYYLIQMKYHLRVACILLVYFVVILFFGPHLVNRLYENFIATAACFLFLPVFLLFMNYRFIRMKGLGLKAWYAVTALFTVVAIVGLIEGRGFLEGNRHLLFRAKVHIETVDDILMENDVDSRDMERLFEASQNRWYLGHYAENSALDPILTPDRPYRLRPHFNKGVTWETQKTDVVTSRYLIGEHSVWALIALLLMFALLVATPYICSRGLKRYTLLGTGAMLVLFCQSLFITMAVTNRFVFFGQDFPLLSQHSLLTLLLTNLLFSLALISSLSPGYEGIEDNEDYNPPSRFLPVLLGFALLALGIIQVRELTDVNRFNVSTAIQEARQEIAGINSMFRNFQETYREELIQSGALQPVAVRPKVKKDEKYTLKDLKKLEPQYSSQTDYSKLMQAFDEHYGLKKSFETQDEEKTSGISPFTASLYKTYLEKLSKKNNPFDIIHLKAGSNGIMELQINSGYYLLTTPEMAERAWTGHILPDNPEISRSSVTVRGAALPLETGSMRIEHSILPLGVYGEKGVHFNNRYGITFLKLDESWIPEGQGQFVVRAGLSPVTVKSGVHRFDLKEKNNRFLALHMDDEVTVHKVANRGLYDGFIRISGDAGKYFGRNMLVNGKRMMVYPLGEKFMYPYHLNRLAAASFSSKDKKQRSRDLHVTLDYTLTENLYDELSNFGVKDQLLKPDARGLIVANSDGEIQAMITAKNPFRKLGFRTLDPNDEQTISKVQQSYYLAGDYKSEMRTFGDLNLIHMVTGPGSSIKPIVWNAITSRTYYDWSQLELRNSSLQLVKGKAKSYAGRPMSFGSLLDDENLTTKHGDASGKVDLKYYMRRSSNWYNSLMIYLGWYDEEYLEEQLHLVKEGKKAELFVPYTPGDDQRKFPTFTLDVKGEKRKFNFKTWVDDEDIYENRLLARSFEQSYGLMSKNPFDLHDYAVNRCLDIFREKDVLQPDKYINSVPYAYPQLSYLPDKERTNTLGRFQSIRNTTFGASPYAVTPLAMAEMYGRLFTQNRNFRLTLNADAEKLEYNRFELAEGYAEDGYELYGNLLANGLFEGMHQVVTSDRKTGRGTAGYLDDIVRNAEKKGYYIYGKTGTVDGEEARHDGHRIGLVISNRKLHGLSDPEELMDKLENHKFYVMYYSTVNWKSDAAIIAKALQKVLSSPKFLDFMGTGEVEEMK